MFVDVLRFWLDRGVDGFRVDVAHGLFKEESLRDQVVEDEPERRPPATAAWSSARCVTSRCGTSPRCTTSTGAGTQVLAKYDGDRMDWSPRPGPRPRSRWPRFVRADEMSQAFNFAWLLAHWSARGVRRRSSPAPSTRCDPSARRPTWVLSATTTSCAT